MCFVEGKATATVMLEIVRNKIINISAYCSVVVFGVGEMITLKHVKSNRGDRKEKIMST